MTNPFLQLSGKDKEDENPFLRVKTGGPIQIPKPTREVAEHDYDNPLTSFGKGLVRGIASPVTNAVDFLATGAQTNDAPILKIADRIKAFKDFLNPDIDPDNQTTGKIAYGAGNLVGFIIPTAKVFGTVEKATQAALETVAPRALNAIGQAAARSTGRVWVGNVARSLPQNIVAGVAGQALVDPESMKTARGFVSAAALSGAGSLLHYKPNAYARGVEEALPDYQQRIRGMRAGEQEAKQKTAKELFNRAYDWGVDAKAPIKRQFDELNRARVASGQKPIPAWQDPGKIVSIASGSGGMTERALFGDGHFYLDEGGNIIKTTESLATYLAPLKTDEEVESMKDVALALHTLDPGVIAKTDELRKGYEQSLAQMDQFIVNIVKKGVDTHQEKDAILKDVYDKLKTRQNINEKDVANAFEVLHKLNRVESAITGINPKDAQQLVANAQPHVLEAAQNLAKFRREGNLKYIETKGLLSPEAAAKWNEFYEHYVSLERVFSNEKDTGKRVFDDILGTKSPTFLKAQEGSRLKIKDPLATTVEQTRISFKRGNENWISKQFYELAKAEPDKFKGVFEVVDDAAMPAEHIEALADRLLKSADENGITMGRKEAREIATFMHPTGLNPTNNTISFFDNGVMRSARVSDEIARAYKSMSPKDMNALITLMSYPARGVRTGVTLSLDFLGFNLIADTYSAWLKSNHGFKLGISTAEGLMESIKDTQFLRRFDRFKEGSAIRQEALAGGFGMGNLSASKDLADNQILNKLLPQTKTQRVINTVLHPVEALKSIAKPLEEATRIGEYMRARRAGEDVTTAALAARNITTDFAQIGGSMKELSAITAFLNPAIQSLNSDAKAVLGLNTIGKKTVVSLPKLITEAKSPIKGVTESGAKIEKVGDWLGNEVDITKFMNGVKSASQLAVKGFGGLALPSAGLWAINRNDQEINDLRKSESGKIYWHIRAGDGTILRVRKPFLFGQVFATGMEEALDAAFEKDPEAVNRWADGMAQQALFAGIPNVLQTAASIWANKDWHTNAPIVPTEQKGTDPQYQGTEQTSQLSKMMSDVARKATLGKVNISPIHMDYIIRSSTGSLGSNLTKTADYVLPKSESSAAAPTKTDLPMIGRFFARYPSQSVEPVRTFYDNLNKAEEVIKTAKRLEEKNPAQLQDYLERNVEIYSLSPIYTETKQQLADIRHTIDEIVSAPDDVISPAEKRTYSDMYMKQIIEITRAVNHSVR